MTDRWKIIKRCSSVGEARHFVNIVTDGRREISTCEHYAEITKYNHASEDRIKEGAFPTFRDWEGPCPTGPLAQIICDALNAAERPSSPTRASHE